MRTVICRAAMYWVEYQTEERRGDWGTWNIRRRHTHVFGGKT